MTNATTVDNATSLYEIFRQLGSEGGKGADSILKAAMFATACVAQKMVGESDAKDLYLAYKAGYDGEVILADNLIADDKIKVQVSCFKTFFKTEVVANGAIHGRALSIRAKIDPASRAHSAYNGLVAINRAQIKKGAVALTNSEIEDVLTKVATDKDDLEKLEALLKTLTKAHEKFGGLEDGITAVSRRIEAEKATIRGRALPNSLSPDVLLQKIDAELADANS